MALGQTADLLFRIRADNSDANEKLNETKGNVSELGDAAKEGGEGFSALAGPAAAAAAAIAVVGTAAITAATRLFELTRASAEYGASLYDVQVRTGLTASTLSALKLNADKTGVAFDEVADSLQDFTILLGEAAAGDKEAEATLAKHGITARDVATATDQAFAAISRFEGVARRSAAATDLLGDSGKNLIPVIDKMKGGLGEARAEVERTGQAMSQKALEDSNRFRDALKELEAQAGATGREFAGELMPAVTEAMRAITAVLEENKGTAASWASALVSELGTVIRGLGLLKDAAELALTITTVGFANSGNAATGWSIATRTAIDLVLGPLYSLIQRLGEAKALYDSFFGGPGTAGLTGNVSKAGAGMGGAFEPPKPVGGGPRRTGGGGGAARVSTSSEPTGPSEYDLATRTNSRKLELYRGQLEREEAALQTSLNNRIITELAYVKRIQEFKLAAVLYEKALIQEILKSVQMSAEDRAEAEHKLAVVNKEIATARIRLSNEVFEQIRKDTEKETKLLEEAARKRRAAIEERKRLDAIERADKNESRDRAARERNEGGLSVLGDSPLSVRNDVGNLTEMISPLVPMAQLAGQAFQQLAQGVGQVIQNFILMGSTGPNAMRKLVAGVLAGVSAQAATMAIMELAYGIAALTPWGFSLYGNPANHFKAAALFGAVAVGAGVAGRLTAGNSFNEGGGAGAGAGGGGGSDPDNGNRPGLNFTERFQGFTSDRDKAIQSLITQIQTDQNATRLERQMLIRAVQRWEPQSATDVLMAAVATSEGSSAVFDASLSEIQADGGKATEWKRGMGEY